MGKNEVQTVRMKLYLYLLLERTVFVAGCKLHSADRTALKNLGGEIKE